MTPAQGLQPAALVELPPVANGAGTDAEEGGDFSRERPWPSHSRAEKRL